MGSRARRGLVRACWSRVWGGWGVFWVVLVAAAAVVVTRARSRALSLPLTHNPTTPPSQPNHEPKNREAARGGRAGQPGLLPRAHGRCRRARQRRPGHGRGAVDAAARAGDTPLALPLCEPLGPPGAGGGGVHDASAPVLEAAVRERG